MSTKDLRLVLTKDCNYNCTFCHHEGVNHEIYKTLTNQDYMFLYDVVNKQQKIDEVTLTGGEPLMYSQIENLSKLLYDKWVKITLVTNGSLLHKHPEIGKRIKRINLSLHTLDQEQYADTTQTKTKISHIIDNITLMRKLYPNLLIRLNATVVKWRNDNQKDIESMINLADKYGLSIKFVELYPHTDPAFLPLKDIEPILESLGFEKYQEKPRQVIYGRWKRIIILTKISCGATGEEENIIPPEESDIFISPDGLVSPYPSNESKLSLYSSLKEKNTHEIEKLLQQAIDEVKVSNVSK